MVSDDQLESEGELASYVVMEARRLYNCTLQRNNAGAFRNPMGRWVRFGLGNLSPKLWKSFRSSDYIGPTVITVTPEMVGKQIAIFTAVETKKPDWKRNPNDQDENAQANYITWVNSIGGLAGFCNSLDTLKDIFRKF